MIGFQPALRVGHWSRGARSEFRDWWAEHDCTALGILAAVAVPTFVGIGVSFGYGLHMIGLLVIAAAIAVGIRDWRLSVYGLLLYLPFAGIPAIALYPSTTLPVLAKDFLFTLPAYLGFILTARRLSWNLNHPSTYFLMAWILIIAAQIFNPRSAGVLVGLIGFKVWLLYVPLMFLGYQLITTRAQLERLLKLLIVPAMIPAAIGLIEALLLYSGHRDSVYALYGAAAVSVTQRFAHTNYDDGGLLLRIPSTFSFVTQYFVYCASMVGVGYAHWRMRHSKLGWLPWAVMLLACVSSGARGAFLMIPLLMLLIVLLDARSLGGVIQRAGAPLILTGAGLAVAFSLFGSTAGVIFSHAVNTGSAELAEGFFQGMGDTLKETQLGLGTGMNTGPARYAFDQQADVVDWGGLDNESWWVKALEELGIPGLAATVCLFGSLVVQYLRSHRGLRDPAVRAVSATFLAFFVWNIFYLTKGKYVDTDPLNVYFWLLIGILARLPQIDQQLHEETLALQKTEAVAVA